MKTIFFGFALILLTGCVGIRIGVTKIESEVQTTANESILCLPCLTFHFERSDTGIGIGFKEDSAIKLLYFFEDN